MSIIATVSCQFSCMQPSYTFRNLTKDVYCSIIIIIVVIIIIMVGYHVIQ